MKRNSIIALSLLLLMSLLSSPACKQDDTACMNQDSILATCDTVTPLSGTLTVKVTLNAENQRVPIAVYFGDIEDNDLYFVDTLTEESVSYNVFLNEDYSAAAWYRDGTARIRAIDGDKVSASSERKCDFTCWTVTHGSVNLRLGR